MVFIRVNVYNYFYHVFLHHWQKIHKLFSFQRAIQHSSTIYFTHVFDDVCSVAIIFKKMNYHILQFTVISYISFFNINSNICAYNYLLKTEIRFYERLLKPSASTCHKKLSCAKWYIFSMSCLKITFLKVCIRSSSVREANEKDEHYKEQTYNKWMTFTQLFLQGRRMFNWGHYRHRQRRWAHLLWTCR